MTLSMYQASVPVFTRALDNLGRVLAKGEAHANDRGYDPAALLQARLAPDMLPLQRQVQIAADMATRGSARLAGVEPRAFADEETTFAQLYARIDAAADYIGTFKQEQIDGSEARPITLQLRSGEMRFDGKGYLLDFLLPNLFFHCTTSYAILRQCGVALGKADFIGAPR